VTSASRKRVDIDTVSKVEKIIKSRGRIAKYMIVKIRV
jgi:hypothetical protein